MSIIVAHISNDLNLIRCFLALCVHKSIGQQDTFVCTTPNI